MVEPTLISPLNLTEAEPLTVSIFICGQRRLGDLTFFAIHYGVQIGLADEVYESNKVML